MSILLEYSPVYLLLCAILAAVGVYWTYRRTVPSLPIARRATLGALRFISLFLICFLLFQPIARHTATRTERPVVAVLIDDSESVSLVSGAGDSLQVDTSPVARVLERLRLGDDVDVRGYRFGARTTELSDAPETWPDSLLGADPRTDIATALAHVQQELSDANLAAVVLVSDGRYNTGSNPIYTAERYPVPVHAVVVGDTSAQRDIAVGRLNANRVAYVGAEQPVEVDVQATGYAGARLSVALFAGGARLDAATVDVAGDAAQVPVNLSYTPESAGLQTITVSVTERDGELTHQNNRASFAVRVLERKRQVLLLAGAPNPDVAAVRQILNENADIEVVARVQKQARQYYEGAMPTSLEAFDALVLVGYPGSVADAEVIRRVREAAAGGKPLLFVLSDGTDLPRLSSEFGDVLPATTRGERPGWMEALTVLTPEGAQHPVFTIPDAAPGDWKRLPPVRMSESRWTPSPDARVLATAEVRGVQLDDPLVVARARAGARSAAFLGAGTWRWKNVPADLESVSSLWPRALANALQWITTAYDERPLRVQPTRESFAGGETVTFSAEAYDESLRPVPDAVIELTLRSENGREYPFQMQSIGNGRYALDAGVLPEGTYEFAARASRGEVEIGTDSGSLAVGELTLEHRDTRADAHLMRQVALRSGGTVVKASDLDALNQALATEGTMAPRTASVVSESNLRRLPSFLILIVCLLTVEWVLRKRSGLV